MRDSNNDIMLSRVEEVSRGVVRRRGREERLGVRQERGQIRRARREEKERERGKKRVRFRLEEGDGETEETREEI